MKMQVQVAITTGSKVIDIWSTLPISDAVLQKLQFARCIHRMTDLSQIVRYNVKHPENVTIYKYIKVISSQHY